MLQCLRILVTSALDALVAILENHAVFLEKLEPAVFKLFVVFHLVDQFFEDCFVNLAYVVLLETISMISDTGREVQGQGHGEFIPSLQEFGTNLQVPYSREVLAAAREVAD